MPRQASFDVIAFEQKILDAILYSPVGQSRREIFARCDFDYDNRALETAFNRFIQRPTTESLVDWDGDRRNRVYIAKNPPIQIEPEPSPSPPPAEVSVLPPSEPVEVPVHRERPPTPTFTVKEIDDAALVPEALSALSDASGNAGFVALGVDKSEIEKDHAFRAMTYGYNSTFPVIQMIIAAGDVVYDFDIIKIFNSVFATSDDNNIRDFAPFRDFFANHTIVCHDALSTCTPLFDLDIPPRAMQETRLAVRMLQYQEGVSGNDLFKADVLHYLKQPPYSARTARIATVLPLLCELRERLGDKLTTYETYCAWLPRLASQQKPLTLGLQHPDLLDYVDLPVCQQVEPTFEILGDGGIQLKLSLYPAYKREQSHTVHVISNIKDWWAQFSMIVTVRFSSKAETHQILSMLSALESTTVVFHYNETVPERIAIVLMKTIKGFVDDAYIHLRRGDGCNDSGSGEAPVGWRDEWWDSWVDLADADVQSVLKS